MPTRQCNLLPSDYGVSGDGSESMALQGRAATRSRPSRCRRARLLLVLVAAGLSALWVGPTQASTNYCGDTFVQGAFIDWTPGPNLPDLDTFSCGSWYCPEAKDDGFFRVLVPSDCDPLTTTSCTVQLRVPVTVEGNHQTTFDPAKAHVRWFDRSTPCDPSSSGCNEAAVCGTLAQIRTDSGEAWIQVSNIGCSNLSGHAGLQDYSLSVYRCEFGSCETRHDVPGLSLSPPDLEAFLGCPIIPTQSCNGDDGTSCRDCLAGGVGIGGGGPGIGGRGGGEGKPSTGNGAYLYYTAGGPGHPACPAPPPGGSPWAATGATATPSGSFRCRTRATSG